MSLHSLTTQSNISALEQAKIELAACLRMAVVNQLDSGLDKHFTIAVPGRDDAYLVLPFGVPWSEARASELITFNEAGQTLAGTGAVEISARCLQAPIHRITGAQVVLHSQQTWALALNLLDNNRLVTACQTAAFFDQRIAYDDGPAGPVRTPAEGERLAACLGDKPILFMKNRGVLVTGGTLAQAFLRLYKLECVCRTQVLAMSTGQALQELSPEAIRMVNTPSPFDRHPRPVRERLFFAAMMRVVDRALPGYAN